MQELLSALVVWLAVNVDLPASFEHPRVELVPPARLTEIRGARIASATAGPAVHAFYDDAARTVYLDERWTASSPAGLSVLVHELVHHLQNVGGVRHACTAEREGQAYRAQARWLEQLGTDLETEFGIDAMTLLVRTRCMH